MKKIFVSQPMRGKTDEEIIAARSNALQTAKDAIDEEVQLINSFFEDAPVGENPLWYLGESIKLLAGADAAVFAKGWETARGCRIERMCAREYGIHTIEEFGGRV